MPSVRTKAAWEGLAISRQLLAPEKFPHHNCIVTEHRDDDVIASTMTSSVGIKNRFFSNRAIAKPRGACG
jgi:hypothetical protein